MLSSIFNKAQQIALQVSGSIFHLEKENIPYKPSEREYLLPDDRQQYNNELSIPVPENLSLCDHIMATCSEISDEVRALRNGARIWRDCPLQDNSIEKIYAMIEGENYIPPSSLMYGDLAAIHSCLDIFDDLQTLEDAIIMYPEVARQDKRQSWCEFLSSVKDDFLGLLDTIGVR